MSEHVVFWIIVSITVLTLIVSAHSAMWTAVAAWHYKGSRIVRTQGINAYRRHKAAPPWYVRYTDWLDKHVLRSKEG